jgi:Family of unknown function (DUF5677)
MRLVGLRARHEHGKGGLVKLPGEDTIRRSIARSYRQDLELAGRFLEFATGTLTGLSFRGAPPGMDALSTVVSIGLLVKMCKQTRSVLALVRLGLREDAESLLRLQFEAMLAALFILRRRVRLKRGGRTVKPVATMPFDSPFRAKLYIAHAYAQDGRMYDEVTRTAGIKRTVGKKFLDSFRAQADDWKKDIGPEWAERQKQGKGYAGMPLCDLAASLGLGVLYASLYRHISAAVHATDAVSFIGSDGDDSLTIEIDPTDKGLGFPIRFTCLFLVRAVSEFNRRFGLGLEADVNVWVDAIASISLDDDE